MNIYIDLETLPADEDQREGFLLDRMADVQLPLDEDQLRRELEVEFAKPETVQRHFDRKLIKHEEKRAADLHNAKIKADKDFRDTALSGDSGRIFCIAWRGFDEHGSIKGQVSSEDITEGEMLIEFVRDMNDLSEVHIRDSQDPDKCTSRNIPVKIHAFNASFDISMIWKRCVILGVPYPKSWPTPVDVKPWSDNVYDPQALWWPKTHGMKGTGQDRLCDILGIDRGDDIKGSDVYDYCTRGETDEIIRHCKNDVDRLYQICQKLKGVM